MGVLSNTASAQLHTTLLQQLLARDFQRKPSLEVFLMWMLQF